MLLRGSCIDRIPGDEHVVKSRAKLDGAAKLQLARRVFEVRSRAVARAAYAAALLNFAAGVVMVVVLRPGLSVGGDLQERIAYLIAHPAAWRVGWLVWQAAALSLLVFYAGLSGLWMRIAPLRSIFAVLCATAGVAVDLSAESILMGPGVSVDTLVVADRLVGMLTGYLANGLYTLGGVLLTWAGLGQLPRALVVLSLPVWLAGIALSMSVLLDFPRGQSISLAVVMPSFVLWSAGVGWWLNRRAS